jgi:hypothetical protein
VEKYDRLLQVKVLHTTPAPGSLFNAKPHVAGTPHILDVTASADWSIDTLSWFEPDHRVVLAAEAAPCINGAPALGSASVKVKANLEPRSEYDLLLNVAPSGAGAADEVLVARSHFRTSAYRNPTELLASLGFANPLGVFPPTDAIAKAPLPGGPLVIGDAEMDDALCALGLDPWPLSASPRTTVIWREPAAAGQPWQVVAILLEADEPIWRAGFLTGAIGEIPPPPRLAVQSLQISRTFDQTKVIFMPTPKVISITLRGPLGSLTEQVRSTAGTRSLFTPPSPIAITGGRMYDVALQFAENGSPGASGITTLLDRPVMISEEGE